MNTIFLEEIINSYFEGRLGKKEALKNKTEEAGFDKIYSQAAQLIMERTKRNSGKAIPGGLPFTSEDIIFILDKVKADTEFTAGIKTAKQLADKVIDLCFEILEIANGFVESSRIKQNYKGKLAYEISDSQRRNLADSIKVALQTIWLLQKKRIKVESKSDAQTLVMRKVLNYIVGKSPEIEMDLQSIEKDLQSTNAKTKAEAMANLKNLGKHLNSKNVLTFIRNAFDTVKKYSGSDSLIWPTLPIKVQPGDEYASLFKYIDAYKEGKDIKHAQKWVSQFKNKTKEQIKRKIIIEQGFRKLLKATVKAHDINKIPGGSQTIKNLQEIASKLMKANPEYVKYLQIKEGIKETIIDEIVSMLAGFIRVGALEVKDE